METCKSYGHLWRIKFNLEKTHYMTLGKALIKNSDFKINNEYIYLNIRGNVDHNIESTDNTTINIFDCSILKFSNLT